MLGSVHAQYHNEHVSDDVVLAVYPATIKRKVLIRACSSACICLCGILLSKHCAHDRSAHKSAARACAGRGVRKAAGHAQLLLPSPGHDCLLLAETHLMFVAYQVLRHLYLGVTRQCYLFRGAKARFLDQVGVGWGLRSWGGA